MNMKNQMPKPGKKGALTGLVISFCAIIALVGVYTFNQYQENVEENFDQLVASGEDTSDGDTQKTELANTDDIVNPEITEDMIQASPELEIIEEEVLEERTEIAPDIQKSATQPAVEFQVTDDLIWPVSGEVLMGYNMAESVYFETLDQYKRNPAMIISTEVGNQVTAAGRGIVQYVEEKSDTGLTVTLDMGNGFQAIYGQLADVKVSEGELVEVGGVIGKIAEPSMYYSLEGANLYFEFIQNGDPIDPIDYLG